MWFTFRDILLSLQTVYAKYETVEVNCSYFTTVSVLILTRTYHPIFLSGITAHAVLEESDFENDFCIL